MTKKNKDTTDIKESLRSIKKIKRVLGQCGFADYNSMTLQDIEDLFLKILGKQEFSKYQEAVHG